VNTAVRKRKETRATVDQPQSASQRLLSSFSSVGRIELNWTTVGLRSRLRFLVYRVHRTICGHSWTTVGLRSRLKFLVSVAQELANCRSQEIEQCRKEIAELEEQMAQKQRKIDFLAKQEL
jgi:hypothetical protein